MAATVRFRLDEDDMVHAARLFALSSLRQHKTQTGLIALFLVILVLMSLIAGIVFPLDTERLARHWPYVLLASLFPFLIVFALGLVVNPLLARRIYRQQRSLHGEIGLSWTDERLEFDSEYGQFAMPWSHFTRWAEDKRTFVLFESDRLYRIVPKRVLDADTELSLRERLAGVGT